MKIKLNRDNQGKVVLDILKEKNDNRWEVSFFDDFINDCIEHGTLIEKRNDPINGDIVRFSNKKYE